MRGFTITKEWLTQRDNDFLDEIGREAYNGYISPRFFSDQLNEDDSTVPKYIQEQFILRTRKDFAEWKLRRKRREARIEKEKNEYEIKQKRDLLLHKIQCEKRALFRAFNAEKRPLLGLSDYNNWRTWWEHYYSQNNTHKNDLKQFEEYELDVFYDDTYI